MKTRRSFIFAFLLVLLTLAVCVWVHFRGNPVKAGISNKPPVPVKLAYRKALLGSGYVFMIENLSERSQTFRVALSNRTLKKKTVLGVTIDSRKTKEVGHLQGWAGASGDVIEVQADGFASAQNRIP